MTSAWLRIRQWLFGSKSVRPATTKATATALIDRIAHGGLRGLSDQDLMDVVELLLANFGLRTGLRGNVRFLDSVLRQWGRKGTISPRQRQGILNVLERAYPHNLAAVLRYM